MKRNEPLTLEELKELSDKWFPLFEEVHGRLPEGTSIDETLKVMDKLAQLAGVQVAEQEQKDRELFYYRGRVEPLHQT